MADKLILDFLHEWVRDPALRCKVLHKEQTEMTNWGLNQQQHEVLRSFETDKIVEQILKECKELGIDLDDLREAIHGGNSPTGSVGSAAYDEGKTHIRRVIPAVVPINVERKVVLLGQGFKEDATKVTVECVQQNIKKPAKVLSVECGVDVWQRVEVKMTLDQSGKWVVRAHNDDNLDQSGQPIWSDPFGVIHVF